MGVLAETIRLRASSAEVSAAEVWARNRGETVSGMIRRLLAQEVPGLGSEFDGVSASGTASILADVLAGEPGGAHRMLEIVKAGSAEARDEMLRALVGYLVWEYRAPPDAAGAQEIIEETARLFTDDAAAAGIVN